MTQRESTKAALWTDARSSKQIQNDEKQNNYNAPNGKDRIHCFGFSDFEFIWPRFVSDFVLRISDFDLWLIGVLSRE